MWRTYSWVYTGHNCSCISDETCVIPLRETFYFNDVSQNWNSLLRPVYSDATQLNSTSSWVKLSCVAINGPLVKRRKLSACVMAHALDSLSTFCGVFMVQCVKLMLNIFEFGILLFHCFVYRQNVTCLKRFTRYGHYAGEVEDIIKQTRSCLWNRCCAQN